MKILYASNKTCRSSNIVQREKEKGLLMARIYLQLPTKLRRPVALAKNQICLLRFSETEMPYLTSLSISLEIPLKSQSMNTKARKLRM